MVNCTLLNFGKRLDNNLRIIFDQWLKLHLGLDALSNQRILKGVYYLMKFVYLRQYKAYYYYLRTLIPSRPSTLSRDGARSKNIGGRHE